MFLAADEAQHHIELGACYAGYFFQYLDSDFFVKVEWSGIDV